MNPLLKDIFYQEHLFSKNKNYIEFYKNLIEYSTKNSFFVKPLNIYMSVTNLYRQFINFNQFIIPFGLDILDEANYYIYFLFSQELKYTEDLDFKTLHWNISGDCRGQLVFNKIFALGNFKHIKKLDFTVVNFMK